MTLRSAIARFRMSDAEHGELVMRQATELLARDEHPIPVTPFHGGGAALGSATPNRLMRALKLADSATANRAIADRVSSIGVHAFKKLPDGEKVADPDTRLEDLQLDPNPVYTMAQLLSIISWTLAPAGGAFLQVLHDGGNIPTQLWPLPWNKVKPIATRSDPLSHYEVLGSDGTTTTLSREEVIYFWFPDPENPLFGMGRLPPQAVRWDTARAQEQHHQQTYQRDGTPRWALKSQGVEALAPEGPQLDAFHTQWRNRFDRLRGISNGLPAWLPPGFDVHEFAALDFQGQNELSRMLSQHNFRAFGVPLAILGEVTDVNRANTDGVNFIFDRNTILPIWTLIVQALNKQLTPQFDSRLMVMHDEFVMPDKEFELKREDQDLRTKLRTINEVRETRAGLDPVAHGQLPVGTLNEVGYTGDSPFTFSDEAVSDLESPRGGGGPGDPGAARIHGDTEAGGGGVRAFFAPTAQWRRNEATEREFLTATRKLTELGLRIPNRDVAKRLMAAARSRALADVNLADIFNPNDARWATEWGRRMGPQWTEIFVGGGVEVFEGLELASTFELTPTMVDQVAGNIARLSQETGSASWRSIGEILRKGIADGASPSSVAARIKTTTFSSDRAKTIARTEIGKANQQGQQLAMENSQVVQEKRWNTSQDGDVRPSHRIDGQKVSLSSEFTLKNGQKAQHPLDPGLPVGDVVNCRCFVTPVV